MEKVLIIFVVCILAGLLVYLFPHWKKYRAKKEVERQKAEVERQMDELIEACKNADINKLIELLEKGLNPNTKFEAVNIFGDEKIITVMNFRLEKPVKRLLRAYGAKTIEEIKVVENVIKKARRGARIAEYKRREAIRLAEEKAKEEADMKKVEAFLASKDKKA